MPDRHTPPSQSVPFGTAVAVHWPSEGLQPSVVHGLSSSQVVPLHAAVQVPFVQTPPLHAVLSATSECWHPVCGSQTSAVHSLPSSQFDGTHRLTHVPPWHLPALQSVPSATGLFWQP